MKIPELLIPAGGMRQLEAAIANGADAVYMSDTAFNARIHAENFKEEEIGEAIALAHRYGVRVHITQNTLVRTDEIRAALEHAARMYELGADALIVQDRGLAALLRQCLPELELHMSTQGTIYDLAGVREMERAGFHRVILSRELSGKEIAEICRQAAAEIEVFVHGALCICYSGQCHMSEFIGGRSGNRGVCAQPCRLPYELLKDGEKVNAQPYPLSPSDMQLLPHLRSLAEAGVASLKIEGRMKSPEYVAIVTKTYRKYLDRIAEEQSVGKSEMEESTESAAQQKIQLLKGQKLLRPEKEDERKLRQIFNRGAFTDAYYRGESGKSLMSDEIPKHQGIFLGTLTGIDTKKGHALVKLKERLSNGDGIEIRWKEGRTAGGVITYIRRQKDGTLLKQAQPGEIVEIGDLPELKKIRNAGCENAAVYKTGDRRLTEEAEESCRKLPQRVPVDMCFSGKTGERAVLKAWLTSGNEAARSSDDIAAAQTEQPLEAAMNRPADEEDLRRRLSKTGDTPYYLNSCEIQLQGAPAISAATLNALRRTVLEKLTEKRTRKRTLPEHFAKRMNREFASQYRTQFSAISSDNEMNADASLQLPELTLHFYETVDLTQRLVRILELLEQEKRSTFSYRIRINVPYRFALQTQLRERIRSSGILLTAYFPAISKPKPNGLPTIDETDLKVLKALLQTGEISGISVANPSQLIMLQEQTEGDSEGNFNAKQNLYFEESMNLYNKYAFRSAKKEGMICGVLSHELKPLDTEQLQEAAETAEFTVWGRIPLMYMEHCPIGSSADGRNGGENIRSHGSGSGKSAASAQPTPYCTSAKKYHYCRTGSYQLRDRKGERFQLMPDDSTCRCTILSHRPVDYLKESKQLLRNGIRSLRICIFDESPSEILEKMYKLSE